MAYSSILPVTLYKFVIPVVFAGGLVVFIVSFDKHIVKVYNILAFKCMFKRTRFENLRF